MEGDSCNGLLPIVRIIRKGIFPIIWIGIPIILILLGTIDLGKAVISSDEKEVKAAQSRLIKRCIYAVLVFFVATLVNVLMNIISSSSTDSDDINTIETTSWSDCWRAAGE
ncbi:MAG: hypothetical protein IKE70_04450 [Bacilli bacterium]|nr:hypothetical protein [Bacilli bacterium]